MPTAPRASCCHAQAASAQLLAQDEACRLIEVGCGTHEDFGAAHIPGACWLDTASLETPPLYNKVSDDALLALMLGLGVDATTTVILYGRSTLAAARAAHLMLYAGVGDVRLLDGGFDAWRAAGLPCESGAGAAGAMPPLRRRLPGLTPDLLLDTAASAALLEREGTALASIRTWGEFTGATSGYCYIATRGEIPGALGPGRPRGRCPQHERLPASGRAHARAGADRPTCGPAKASMLKRPDRVLLRHRLARLARVFLCMAHGLGAHRRVRRWLVLNGARTPPIRSCAAPPSRCAPERVLRQVGRRVEKVEPDPGFRSQSAHETT
ncbi:hypothetical protein LP419_36300 [Massilia sp. H-1]|nr:hypothetical protein LP419_36300 [Massilia sp. H-1]